jgi:hypothetical protein
VLKADCFVLRLVCLEVDSKDNVVELSILLFIALAHGQMYFLYFVLKLAIYNV